MNLNQLKRSLPSTRSSDRTISLTHYTKILIDLEEELNQQTVWSGSLRGKFTLINDALKKAKSLYQKEKRAECRMNESMNERMVV